MQCRADRPAGVAALAVALALKGVASLVMATDLAAHDLATATHADEPAALVAVVTGLLLLFKARGLWTLHRGAWLATLAFLLADGLAAVYELASGARQVSVWVSLALAVAVAAYLLQPGVRGLFAGRRARS